MTSGQIAKKVSTETQDSPKNRLRRLLPAQFRLFLPLIWEQTSVQRAGEFFRVSILLQHCIHSPLESWGTAGDEIMDVVWSEARVRARPFGPMAAQHGRYGTIGLCRSGG